MKIFIYIYNLIVLYIGLHKHRISHSGNFQPPKLYQNSSHSATSAPSEPMGSSAPRLPSKDKGDIVEHAAGSVVPLFCEAQSNPVPRFR